MFHSHHVQFSQVDPEDNGLHEEIAEEQLEPEAIALEDVINGEELSEKWQSIETDIKHDPDWFTFTEE